MTHFSALLDTFSLRTLTHFLCAPLRIFLHLHTLFLSAPPHPFFFLHLHTLFLSALLLHLFLHTFYTFFYTPSTLFYTPCTPFSTLIFHLSLLSFLTLFSAPCTFFSDHARSDATWVLRLCVQPPLKKLWVTRPSLSAEFLVLRLALRTWAVVLPLTYAFDVRRRVVFSVASALKDAVVESFLSCFDGAVDALVASGYVSGLPVFPGPHLCNLAIIPSCCRILSGTGCLGRLIC